MTILTKTFSSIPINYDMIYAYASIKDNVSKFKPDIDNLLSEVINKLTYKVCYTSLPIVKKGETLDLGFYKSTSKNLNERINSCSEVIIFASTIGIEIDKLIKKYNHLSPLKALLLQAIGTERIECLCNAFCSFMESEYSLLSKSLKPRFSPGYGDLPLTMQKEIFNLLNCPKFLGLTLNDSMLMSPSKSVTAIIGVYGK